MLAAISILQGCAATPPTVAIAEADRAPQPAMTEPARPAAISSATVAQPVRAPATPANSAASAPRGPVVPGAPIVDIREIKDQPPIARMIDLTKSPDDLWQRMRNGFAMPNLSTPLVLDRQIWYASRPSYIQRMAERSKLYLYYIVGELEKRGMPTELALLPMVESAFNPMALSSARASGLWQFIPSTGKNYNLTQNWWYDARRDIVASTNAALDYLQMLYEMHGDWHLALASYNWGENAVARAIQKNKAAGLPTDYASLTMPQETRYYVPKLQALKNIIAIPESFRINLDPIPNEPYFVTVPTKDIDIRLAAKLADMPVQELLALNPAHNRPVIAHGDWLVLPADRLDIFKSNLENHDKPLVSWQPYTFRKGDRLDKLATERGIALAKLRQVNSISAKTKVAPGFELLLPVKGSGAAAEPLPALYSPPAVAERATRTVTRRASHTVARGETLATIAQHYDVSVDDLRRWNKIGRLTAGQKLAVEYSVAAPAKARSPSRHSTAKKKNTTRTATRGRGVSTAARSPGRKG